MNEVTFGYISGVVTLTFGVYTSAGVQKEVGTALTETPASSGLYLGTPTDIDPGDMVIIKEGTLVVGQGQYKPEMSASAIEAKIDIIDTNVDTLISNSGKISNVTEQKETDVELTKARIYL